MSTSARETAFDRAVACLRVRASPGGGEEEFPPVFVETGLGVTCGDSMFTRVHRIVERGKRSNVETERWVKNVYSVATREREGGHDAREVGGSDVSRLVGRAIQQ